MPGVRVKDETGNVSGSHKARHLMGILIYLEVLERYVVHHDSTPVDWGEVWRTVEKVSPEEWDGLKTKLRESYRRITEIIHAQDVWDEDSIGGAMAMVVHSAYHLGEIRQALCTLQA